MTSTSRSRLPSPARWIVALLLVVVAPLAHAQDDRGATDPAVAGPPARVSVLVFEGGRPVPDLNLRIGEVAGRTDENGSWSVAVPAQRTRLTVFDNAMALTALPLTLRSGELLQVIITLRGESRRAFVSLESSMPLDESALPQPVTTTEVEGEGVLVGQVRSSEDGAPVVDARLFVSGTPVEARTDEDGRFRIDLPVGTYSVSVLHSEFATRTIEGVEIAADAQTERNFDLPPAGLELAEFVVVEPFIEGSLSSVVELRRESTAVTDVLSAEQISRAGDSDAGSALKRVTGLTLVDGSFIYVRGLGERYSSVLLNGANLPSPDPTRRVLPLDLFPTDIISQIVVQKTSDASMPGEFGGGSVQLKTVEYPEEFLLRLSLSTGFNSESTGQTGLTSPGGDNDWTGFDDGTRDVPPLLAERTDGDAFLRPQNIFNPEGATPEELELIGEQVAEASAYSTSEKDLPADRGFAMSLGNSFDIADEVRIGFLGAMRYSDQWRLRDEQRDTFRFSGTGLQPNDSLSVQRTLRNIDLSAFFNTGIAFSDWTRLGVNLMLLRQTESETRISDGQQDSQRLRRFLLEWTENELFSVQAFGEHRLPWIGTEIKWQYTDAAASRDDPNTRTWRRDDDNEDGTFEFSRRADSNSQSWAFLNDDAISTSLDLTQALPEWGPIDLTVRSGINYAERVRDASIRTFSFIGGIPIGAGQLDQDELLTPPFISPSGLRIRESTTPSDNYDAEQELTGYYGMLELTAFDDLTLVGGARLEDNFQQVIADDLTNPDAPPTVGLIDESDLLWSGSLTYRFLESAQVRFGYSETLSRPDFREISPSPFIDPLIDLRTVGNPDLETTAIENLDARVEYYFNEVDSISFAYFSKSLTNPIERVTSSGGSGTIITLQNADGAEVEGWEIDLYRGLGFVNQQEWLDRARLGWLRRIGLENFYIAANYADITTQVNIDPTASNATNPDRALQGASPWVINAQIGYTSPGENLEITLLYNSFGERISRAGTLGQPDVFEQPFDQIDVTAQYAFDRFTLKFSVENLLDSTVEFTQGEETTRRFKPGMKFGLGLGFRL